MGYLAGYAAELFILAGMCVAQWRLGYAAFAHTAGWPAALRIVVRAVLMMTGATILIGLILSLPSASSWPRNGLFVGYVRGGALLWSLASSAAWVIYRVLRLFRWRTDEVDPARRALLRTAGAAAVAAPFAVVGFGALIERTAFGVREIDVPIPDLHRDLQDLRLVQLSDIHLSPFLSEREFSKVVDTVNDLRPHLVLVTGDLISSHGDPLDACLHQLSRLRSDAGVLGCLGNHEIYTGTEAYTTAQAARLGIPFLRYTARQFRFGSAVLNIGGVDYQKMSWRSHYLQGAEGLVAPGALNILLSHNPDVFPAAAGQHWDVTLAGHTHGGQVNVEILHQSLNVARFYTPYVYGLYRSGRSSIYVTRGIGTIGMPARLGAPPEIAVLRLRKA
jgi:predicted MPP superfamily phosphohydrolase